MKTHLPVTHIMSSQVISVEKEASLNEVETLMKRKHIRHLPVVNGTEIIGIISLTDLQRLTFNASFADESDEEEVGIMNILTLEQVMINRPFTIQKTTTVGEAADILIRMDFHALPVLDGVDLIGIVTSTDLLKFFTGKI